MATVGSVRERWLVSLYLQFGDPAVLRAHVGIVVGLIILMAVAEEILWRGFVTSLLAEVVGSHRAWVWAAVLYALAHLPTAYILRSPRVRLEPGHRPRCTRWRPRLGLHGAPFPPAAAGHLLPRALRLDRRHDVPSLGPEHLSHPRRRKNRPESPRFLGAFWVHFWAYFGAIACERRCVRSSGKNSGTQRFFWGEMNSFVRDHASKAIPLLIGVLAIGAGCHSTPSTASAAPSPVAVTSSMGGNGAAPDVAALVAKVKPSVVNITAEHEAKASEGDHRSSSFPPRRPVRVRSGAQTARSRVRLHRRRRKVTS